MLPHSTVGQLPLNSPTKPQLCRVLELIEHGMEEVRQVVRGLRSA
jgi:hypothetical protein